MDIIKAIRDAQASNKIVAVIDNARTFDVMAARAEGVNVGRMLVSQPDNEGQCADICETLARSGTIDLMLIIGGYPVVAAAELIRHATRSGMTVTIAPRWDESATFPDLLATA